MACLDSAENAPAERNNYYSLEKWVRLSIRAQARTKFPPPTKILYETPGINIKFQVCEDILSRQEPKCQTQIFDVR